MYGRLLCHYEYSTADAAAWRRWGLRDPDYFGAGEACDSFGQSRQLSSRIRNRRKNFHKRRLSGPNFIPTPSNQYRTGGPAQPRSLYLRIFCGVARIALSNAHPLI
jgi:hypothetical protein